MKIDFSKEPSICDKAKKFIQSVCKKLTEINALEEIDEGALYMLMVSYDSYVKASRELIEKGPIIYDKHGRAKPNPAAKESYKYYAQVVTFMKEYGLTIKSRERIKAMTPEVDETNEIMQFFKQQD